MKKVVKLIDVTKIIMGQSPKGETYNRESTGLPLLNGPTEYGETYPQCTLFTTDSKRECEKGDLIFCVRGSTTGKMNWADRTYSLGRGVCSFRGKSALETKYIKYCLDNNLEGLLNFAGGGTFPNLTKETIENFEIPYFDNRLNIASMLSAYDDLIENNTRCIKILEEMAQAIYKEWFVNFRFHDHEKAKFFDSPLGRIPEGWEVKKFDQIFEFTNGHAFYKAGYSEDGYIVIDLGNISEEGQLIMTGKEKYVSEEIYKSFPKFHLFKNDVIVAMTDITYRMGILAKTALIDESNKYILNQRVGRIRSRLKSINYPFLYHSLSDERFIESMKKVVKGTSQKYVNTDDIKNYDVIIPEESLIKKYEDIIVPLLSQLRVFNKKIINLRQTRDLLLPKLMSGEVEV